MTPKGGRHYERWVPGVRVARTYERRWLRADLVAGIVLAAILVPQGMAYAELAGLPAVTGLYTTIACLVAYAVFGPSRVLVLGPDSSVSPLIFAAIVPLMAAGDPATAIALAGMLALMVGLIEIGLGLGKLGFVADLLSKEVQVGYMNGLAITIIVGQLPKLFGFSTDADGFIAELKAFFAGLDKTNATTLIVGVACLARPARAAAAHAPRAGGARRRRRRHDRVGGARPRRARREDGRRAASGRADAGVPVDQRRRRRPAAHRRGRHHARVAHRHHRHRDELRRPTRRRGRARPGDDRRSAPRTSPPGSSRASPCRRAARARRWPSSRAPRARSPASSAPASSSCSCCSSTGCSPTCPRRPLPRS